MLVDGPTITDVGIGIDPAGREVVDGVGATLLAGFIDCHAHPTGDALALAMLFGVTTEIDMFTTPERLGDQRVQAEKRNDVAYLRSASTRRPTLPPESSP